MGYFLAPKLGGKIINLTDSFGLKPPTGVGKSACYIYIYLYLYRGMCIYIYIYLYIFLCIYISLYIEFFVFITCSVHIVII